MRNPADGTLIASLLIDSPKAAADAVARVRANQAEREGIGDRGERVLNTMMLETGKVCPDASNEPAYLADLINFYGAKAAQFISEEAVRPHTPLRAAKKLRVQHPAHPVVGIISPWNFRRSRPWAMRSRRCKPVPPW